MSSNHGIRFCLLEHLIAVPLRPQHHGLDMEMRHLLVNALIGAT
jgi:hypothetical protein